MQRSRRNNAPVRPYRRPSPVADVLVALAFSAITMAVVFFVVSTLDHSGAAERELARLFAASLLLTGIFLAAIGLGIRDRERTTLDYFIYACFVGLFVGILDAFAFLSGQLWAIPLPLIVLVALFDPFRRRIERMAAPGRKTG